MELWYTDEHTSDVRFSMKASVQIASKKSSVQQIDILDTPAYGRVLVLDGGVIAMDGVPSEIFEREEQLRALGLDVPQCTALVHKLRSAGVSIAGDCTTPEKCAEIISLALRGGRDNG